MILIKPDLFFKVMTQGGSVDSYKPAFAPQKLSPTGRKISVDRVRLNSMDLHNVAATTTTRSVHIYENLPPLPSITITEDDDNVEDEVGEENTDL